MKTWRNEPGRDRHAEDEDGCDRDGTSVSAADDEEVVNEWDGQSEVERHAPGAEVGIRGEEVRAEDQPADGRNDDRREHEHVCRSADSEHRTGLYGCAEKA